MNLCKALQEWSDEERNAGMAEGLAKGRDEGRTETNDNIIRNMLHKNQTPEFISEMTAQPLEYVYEVKRAMTVNEKTKYDPSGMEKKSDFKPHPGKM